MIPFCMLRLVQADLDFTFCSLCTCCAVNSILCANKCTYSLCFNFRNKLKRRMEANRASPKRKSRRATSSKPATRTVKSMTGQKPASVPRNADVGGSQSPVAVLSGLLACSLSLLHLCLASAHCSLLKRHLLLHAIFLRL